MDISVIIPMYNEADNVASTLSRISAVLEKANRTYELIPVDDGSNDETLSIARDMETRDPHIRAVSYPNNIGRGKALRVGFAEARGEIVVSIDADLSYDPEYILDLVRVLDEEDDVDVVLASPYMKGGRTEKVPLARLLVSRVGNMILSFSLPGKFKTVTCVFRAYRKRVLDSLELESTGKEIHLEILSKVLALGYRVKEIPATLRGRRKGKSKFRFRGTAISHLMFSVLQKPMIIFGITGIGLLVGGLIMGGYIVYLKYAGSLNPVRPLMTMVILFLLAGIQLLSFGFIAILIGILRKEILKLQRGNLEIRHEIRRSPAPGCRE
ncbi:MAG: glycosyltransferase [Deltaproteobacteria bacterium]|nr:glycosyltransferase [Deltaproteobacteria bacterium]